jgi:uncharacterized protein (TIGR02300 family)
MSIVTSSKAAKLGTKRECRSCGASFYDLNKEPPVCPKCKAVYDVNAVPELPPLEPDEEEEEEKKARRKKKDPLDAAARGRFDAGDDDVTEGPADW